MDRIGQDGEREERRRDVRREWERIYPEGYTEEKRRRRREKEVEGLDGCVCIY